MNLEIPFKMKHHMMALFTKKLLQRATLTRVSVFHKQLYPLVSVKLAMYYNC